MQGTITKRHFFKIWQTFGFITAWRVLWSKSDTAMLILMQSSQDHINHKLNDIGGK